MEPQRNVSKLFGDEAEKAHSTDFPLKRWITALLVATAAFLVFSPTLKVSTVWDDSLLLDYINRVIVESGWRGLLTAEFVVGEETGYYRPLVLLSLLWDTTIESYLPITFHLTNVLLHALNSALVFIFLDKVSPSRRAASLGAMVFAIHPVHTEAVAFVSGRTDLMATTFSLVVGIVWAGSWPKVTPWKLLAGGAAFIAAGTCKEVAYLLPVALLSWGVIMPGQRSVPTRRWRQQLPWLGAWAIGIVIVLSLRWLAFGPDLGFSKTARVQSAVAMAAGDPGLAVGILATYLKLLVLPWPLNAFYTSSTVVSSWHVILGAGMFLALCAGFSRASHGRAGIMALLWCLVLLIPVAGIVPIGGAVLAERFLYLPSVGACLVIGWALSSFVRRLRSLSLSYAVLTGLFLALCFITVYRSQIWKEDEVLFRAVLKESPQATVVHHNLGILLMKSGEYEEAGKRFEDAVAYDPSYYDAYLNLSYVYGKMKRWHEAEQALSYALVVNSSSGEIFYNLGIVRFEQGKYEKAVAAYTKAIKMNAAFMPAYNNLGTAYAQLGQWQEAVEVFRQALQLDPGDARSRYNLAEAYLELGDRDRALAEAERLRLLDRSLYQAISAQIEGGVDSPSDN
jgi:tetratricopeptide (TPR) repeat protein